MNTLHTKHTQEGPLPHKIATYEADSYFQGQVQGLNMLQVCQHLFAVRLIWAMVKIHSDSSCQAHMIQPAAHSFQVHLLCQVFAIRVHVLSPPFNKDTQISIYSSLMYICSHTTAASKTAVSTCGGIGKTAAYVNHYNFIFYPVLIYITIVSSPSLTLSLSSPPSLSHTHTHS